MKNPKTTILSSIAGKLIKRLYQPSIDQLVNEKVKEALNKARPSDLVVNTQSIVTPQKTTEKPMSLGVGFQTLRDFADFYPIARACVEHRKSQITKLDWNISPIEINKKTTEDKKNIKDIKELKKLFKHPDSKSTSSFTKWLKKILEDLLVIDAVALYRLRNLRQDITGYLPIDGATIELILNKDGTIPDPPQKAYVQKIQGKETARLNTDELIYTMMSPRSYNPFGFAPLESLIITVTTALKLQAFNLAYLCYDEQTEILTNNGWKYFKDLSNKDLVATRNKQEKFEWQKPSKRVSFDYNKNLIRFKSNTIDLLVTPNHRMLTDYRGSHGKFTKKNIIKRADWFLKTPKSKTQNYLAPTTSIWNGKLIEYFKLPSYKIERVGKFSGYAFAGRDKNNKPIRNKKKFITEEKKTVYYKPSIKVPIKDWVAFLGLYLAEGWTRSENNESRHEIYISQSKKSKHWEKIKKLLDKLPFNFRWVECRNLFECSDARLWTYLKQFGHSYDKYIPQKVKNYSDNLLKILWKWAIIGDGHKSGSTFVYSTVSKRLAGDYQEILQKIGKEGRVSIMYQEVGGIIKGKKKPIKTTLPIYKVFERTSKHRNLSCASEEHYNGKVYSVKVPSGIVYVRRNGIPIWCGNTEGNVPEGFVSVPKDIASSRDQLKEWQQAWDAMLSGDPRFQRKLKFLPEGMKYDPTIKVDDMNFERFEKWILQNVCCVFGVQPTEIGFNFEVNRSTSETSYEVGKERGLFPTALFVKEMMDSIIQEDLGYEDLTFIWTNINPTNKLDEARVAATLLDKGVFSIDEVRVGEGLHPIGADEPTFSTPIGHVFVKDLIAQSDSGQMPILPYKPTSEAGQASQTDQEFIPNVPPQAQPKQKQKPKPTSKKVEKIEEEKQKGEQEVIEELRRWRKAAVNDLKQNKTPRDFKTDIIDLRTQDLIRRGLQKAKERKEIDDLFNPFISSQHQINLSLLNFYDELNKIINTREAGATNVQAA